MNAIPIVTGSRLDYSQREMSRNIFSSFVFLLCLFSAVTVHAEIAEDLSSASVYAYFDISDSNEDSSLSFAQFSQQIEEIGDGNYTVLSIDDMLGKEEQGTELPPNTVVITFDDPDADTYAKAIPYLVEKKIPFTIFISPGNTDAGEWDNLKSLNASNLVTIGLTSFSYGHLGAWSEQRITEDLNKAKSAYRDNMNAEPLYFAYPFGNYSSGFVNAIQKSGFKAAFGQNSGVVTKSLDKMKLPRFTMTDDYGDLERFRTTSNALPFPAKDIQPSTSYMTSFPNIGFTVDERIPLGDIKKISCFASGDTQPKINFLGSGRVEIRFDQPPVTDRLRINCTIPVAGELEEDEPRYRWLAFLLYFPVRAEETETDFSPAQP